MPTGFYGPLSASAGMLGASGPSPYPTNIRNVMGAGLAGYLSGAPLDAEDQRKKQTQEALGKIGNTVQAAWQSTAAPLAKQSGISMSYLDSRARAESGNRNVPQSVNPTGSAFGPFQFTEGTWNDLINRHPELGLTPQDRFDPAAQGKAVVPFTADNSSALKAGGVPVGPLQLALAHQFGANGALAILKAKPKTSVGSILPDAVAANPQWADMTAEDIIGATQKQQGEKKGDQAAAPDQQTDQFGGLLSDSTTPITSGGGLADLLGGGGIAQQPFGAGLENMTPRMREIMTIALQDPTLGPGALNALVQVAGGPGAKGQVTPAEAARLAVEMHGQASRESEAEKRLGFMDKNFKQEQANNAALQQYRENQQRIERERMGNELAIQGITRDQKQQEIEQRKADLEWAKSRNDVEGIQKMAQESWKKAVDGADVARSSLDSLDQLESLGSKIHTGTFAGKTKDILNLAHSLGLDLSPFGITESAGPYEAYDALSSNMALHLKNPPGQSNLMPGNQSNYEDDILKSMGTQLSKSPQGNALIIALSRRIGERAKDFAGFAADYEGSKDQKWIQAARSWWERPENQLMSPEFQKKFDAISASPSGVVEKAPGAADISSMSLKDLGDAAKKYPSILTDPTTSSIIRQKLKMD